MDKSGKKSLVFFYGPREMPEGSEETISIYQNLSADEKDQVFIRKYFPAICKSFFDPKRGVPGKKLCMWQTIFEIGKTQSLINATEKELMSHESLSS